jgi:hypothetical protein
MRRLPWLLALTLALAAAQGAAQAAESLQLAAAPPGGEPVPYVLNAQSATPRYVLILFPGGNGLVDPHLRDGQLVYGMRGNFLLRARAHFVDEDFATVSTNASQIPERIQALIDDLHARFPGAQIYLMGTSRGTFDTLALADYLSDRIAGEIHTSSMARIASFDPRKYHNRHLIVHHVQDGCRVTPYGAALSAHQRYGAELISMEGGISVGDPCEALGHHGYNGIERETAEAIKRWVRQGTN